MQRDPPAVISHRSTSLQPLVAPAHSTGTSAREKPPASRPSERPSPSVSGLLGSVPPMYSSRLDMPSPSASAMASSGSAGSRPFSISHPLGMPSPSQSIRATGDIVPSW